MTTKKTLNLLHPDNEGGLFFEREDKTAAGVSTSENRHYISAEKGAFLLITSGTAILSNPVPTALAGAQQRYWHKDHLGSIVAVTDASAGVIERMAYDPFGKRRNIDGTLDQSGAIDAASTNRGFTGHEHLDELDFIHMNARVYDPDIGKFLSADPTVPGFYNPQAYNRYAYTLNNPLNFTDKTGFYAVSSSAQTDSTGNGVTEGGGSPQGQKSEASGDSLGSDPKKLAEQPQSGYAGDVQLAQVSLGRFMAPMVPFGAPSKPVTPTQAEAQGLPISPPMPSGAPPLSPSQLVEQVRTISPVFNGIISAAELVTNSVKAGGADSESGKNSNKQSGLGTSAPDDAPPGTLGLDKAGKKYGWDKDTTHGIKDEASGGMSNGRTWVGVAPDGTVGVNEGGKWSPQTSIDLRPGKKP